MVLHPDGRFRWARLDSLLREGSKSSAVTGEQLWLLGASPSPPSLPPAPAAPLSVACEHDVPAVSPRPRRPALLESVLQCAPYHLQTSRNSPLQMLTQQLVTNINNLYTFTLLSTADIIQLKCKTSRQQSPARGTYLATVCSLTGKAAGGARRRIPVLRERRRHKGGPGGGGGPPSGRLRRW